MGRPLRSPALRLLAVAVVITVLCAGLLLAAIRNDQAITGNLGTATAEVDAVAWDRTIIRFETPDGVKVVSVTPQPTDHQVDRPD